MNFRFYYVGEAFSTSDPKRGGLERTESGLQSYREAGLQRSKAYALASARIERKGA
jgi:hypothetical protein